VLSIQINFSFWHETLLDDGQEHARHDRVFQTSTCSAIAKASSTSMPEISDRTFDLGMPEQKLDGPKIARPPIDQGSFCAAQ